MFLGCWWVFNEWELWIRFRIEESRRVSAQTKHFFQLSATNNQAGCETLLVGLRLARTLKVHDLNIFSFCKTDKWRVYCKGELAQYQPLSVASLDTKGSSHSGQRSKVIQVNREENSEADVLSNLVQSPAGQLSILWRTGKTNKW